MHFRFMAASFDLSLSQTWDSFQICCTLLLDLLNVDIGLNIVLLSFNQSEVSAFPNHTGIVAAILNSH